MVTQYSPKEIRILNSVADLLLEGVSLHNIKVADIAAKAEIGKGTVYEYFSSKEEIISKAVIYRIQRELEAVAGEIESAHDFRQCLFAVLAKSFAYRNPAAPPFFFLGLETYEVREICGALALAREYFFDVAEELVRSFLALGVRDGILDEVLCQSLGYQTVISAFMGFHVLSQKYDESDFVDLADKAYKIIIGALSK